ncbi:hypothetical protein [Marinomonas mediterranea]|uniref:Uncharacterized protein n=1 Tax=Marinomonas mediterranea (strain ATCC 700492 / JCM 21426 / NBRC 103028 / MMB-1) TaxID=717774 RepID=F2JY98_MARM1|nr:hypothetical protein [Marinomonas mediterranea]ADZ91929.1 hypothetical protein Marme_2698 [Marinomonas mediterranea MMB-1]WCN09877.1 hypothetical protein GV055_13605 [Marinomonas mediterranea]WCN13962.1 hypothetical protein GV054_13620 [Marinomonas mediterranea]WCN18013.1 hypothetical protein GV053_13645 [Marinomonas mediterranea MMB-1]
MEISVQFEETSLVIKNLGDTTTIPLGGANSIQLPNGAVIQPPAGSYWHIDMTKSNGVSLQGTHGPVDMPGDSSAYFYVDSL